jgi:hypothetical protein
LFFLRIFLHPGKADMMTFAMLGNSIGVFHKVFIKFSDWTTVFLLYLKALQSKDLVLIDLYFSSTSRITFIPYVPTFGVGIPRHCSYRFQESLSSQLANTFDSFCSCSLVLALHFA